MFNKNPLATKIKNELKLRGISERQKAICLRHSNGRTDNIKKLSAIESEKILKVLSEFTDETLLKHVYLAALELSIITQPSPSIINNNLIIDFLKSEKVIHPETNEMPIQNLKRKVKIVTPFKHLKFGEKELLLSVLGERLIQKQSKGN